MKAVVLAGGKGTRLRPLTYTKPKPLLPLAGEPTITHLIRKLSREGIDEIVLTTNYFAKQLRARLGDGLEYGVRIHHVEEKTPLGTAGSVKNSESLIDETFAVVQSDNQFEFHLKEVVRLHRKLGAMVTIALTEVDDPSGYGIAELSDGRVTRFLEKPGPRECFSNLINTGLYVVEPEVLKHVPEGKPFDFSRNLFPLMLESKTVVAGCRVAGFWVDIGDSRSYLKANIWALDKLQPGRERARDNVAYGPASSVTETATIRGPVYLGKNAKVRKDAVIGPYVCVGDGSEVSAGARIAFSVVYENTRIGHNAILDACIVAENCKIGDRVQIERDAVVGAGTELGNNSHLSADARVGPWTVVQPHAKAEGMVTEFENYVERISGLLEKSHEALPLTIEEARVCGALCELGEANADAISRLTDVPPSRIESILLTLRERGMVTSFGDLSKMFALARE